MSHCKFNLKRNLESVPSNYKLFDKLCSELLNAEYGIPYKTTMKKVALLKKYRELYAETEKLPIEVQKEILKKCFNISEMDPKGKLEDKQAIGTSCKANPSCAARAKCGNPNCICVHCYADKQLDSPKYRGANQCGIVNYIILNTWDFDSEAFKVLKIWDDMPRIEWSGDTGSVRQSCNYIRMELAFPEKTFVPWSKNNWFWAIAYANLGKPKNCSHVVSSAIINVVAEIPEYFVWADHVFTVFDPEYLAQHPEIVINCGGRKCKPCLACYHHDGSTPFYINELLK